MRTLVTVLTPPTQTALTTADAVQAEFPEKQKASALQRLPGLIEQASSLIVGYLGRELARAGMQETIVWGHDQRDYAQIVLSRTPVATLTSVAFDGVDQDLSTIDFDENSGLLYRHTHFYNLDYNISPGYGYGYRTDIIYEGGYLLPGQAERNLPHGIERACIDVVLALWYRAGRGDPMIRSETVDGIGATQYLDPLPGTAGVMPATAVAALAPFCDFRV